MDYKDILENSEKRIVVKLYYSDGNFISFYKGYHIEEWIDLPEKAMFSCTNPEMLVSGAGIDGITLMRDGIHITLYTSETIHYYFRPQFDQYDELKEALKRMYKVRLEVLDIID